MNKLKRNIILILIICFVMISILSKINVTEAKTWNSQNELRLLALNDDFYDSTAFDIGDKVTITSGTNNAVVNCMQAVCMGHYYKSNNDTSSIDKIQSIIDINLDSTKGNGFVQIRTNGKEPKSFTRKLLGCGISCMCCLLDQI